MLNEIEFEGTRYVSSGVAAERLGVAESTVRRRCDREEYDCMVNPHNGYYYISEESIREATKPFGGKQLVPLKEYKAWKENGKKAAGGSG